MIKLFNKLKELCCTSATTQSIAVEKDSSIQSIIREHKSDVKYKDTSWSTLVKNMNNNATEKQLNDLQSFINEQVEKENIKSSASADIKKIKDISEARIAKARIKMRQDIDVVIDKGGL